MAVIVRGSPNASVTYIFKRLGVVKIERLHDDNRGS